MERYFDNDPENDGFLFNHNDDADDEIMEEMSNYFEEEGIYADHLNSKDIMNVMEIEQTEYNLNQQLLDRAISVANKNLLWFFTSSDKKLRKIELIYKRLKQITDINEISEEREV